MAISPVAGVLYLIRAPGRLWRGFHKFRGSILWWLLMKRQRRWVFLSIGIAVFSTLVTIGVAQVTTLIFDEALDARSRPLGPLVMTLAALALLDAIGYFGMYQVNSRIEYQIEFDLRKRLYVQLQRAAPRDLDSVSTGQMVTRSLSDLELLQLLLQILPLIVAFVPILIGYAIYLAFVNVPLTLLTAALFAVNGYLVNRIRPRLWGLAFMGLNQRAEVTTAIDEPVRGIRVVKAFGGEERERKRVKDTAARVYEFVLTRSRLEAKYDLVLRAAPVLVRAALLFFGARLVVGDSFSLGKFIIFYSFLVEGTYIAQYLDELVAVWQLAKTGAGRITQLLAIAPEEVVGDFVPLPDQRSGIQFRRVAAGFGESTVLVDLDMVVTPGSMTVLTGGPGSGKSTVGGLAAGLVAPREGEVMLDGVDTRMLDPMELHRAVHLVTEEPFLFARSVRENLTIGALAGALDPNVRIDDDALWAAIDAAGARDVVEDLDGGLDGTLGDRGMTLSGGQRQRLALARALVAPPRVLVLDDALSAVNPSREVEILRSVRRHAPDTAILCITRRPGPATLADATVALPPAGSHRQVAAADEVEAGDVMLFSRLTSSEPYDPRLAKIVTDLKFAGDVPQFPEEAATRSDEAPTLFRMLPAQGRLLALACFALLFLTAVGLIPEFFFGEAADYIREENTRATDLLAAGLILTALGVGLGNFVFRITSAKVNEGTLYGLRRRVFERLTRLGIDYYDRELPGYVSARVVHDIDVISRFLGTGFGEQGMYQFASTSALIVGSIGVITYLSPPTALVLAPFFVVVLVVTVLQNRVADRAFAAARVRLGDVVARLQEDFAGRYVITAFGAERRALLDFEGSALGLRTARRWAAVVSNSYVAFVQLTFGLAAAAIYLTAGRLALAGTITVGAVISMRLYLDNALRPIRLLGRQWQDYVKSEVAFRQLSTPFAVPVLPVERTDALPCPKLEGAVAFDGVSFTYPGTSKQVLHDLSITVQPGQVVAIVGFTGAGKSSLAKLLGRTYDPNEGRVLVDGFDLRDLDLTSYRRHLGVVPQDAFIFKGTVESNIAYGRPDASREEVEVAARAVGAFDTLAELEGNFAAVVEEEGRNLTAAERQLIALARMWLIEPDVLVLDEATASLDRETEAAVLDAVCSLGRTIILVTHRLQVAERADRAYVIDAGRIIEEGTHSELLAANGPYARLWTVTGQVDPEPV